MRPILPDYAQVEIMGLPHHGKVRGGTLYSVVGPNRTYPQVGGSNLLLAKIKDLPDRTGKQLDIDHDYDWRDRMLLQIGSMGSAPATIDPYHIVHFDDNDVAWLILVAAVQTSLTYRITATIVRRYGVIAESHGPDLNYEFYESSVFDLSAFATSHGLSNLSGTEFVSQNPRGDKALVGVGASFDSPVDLNSVTARVVELTISGSADPETGIGLSGSVSTFLDVSSCVEEPLIIEEGSFNNAMVWRIDYETDYSCTGVPGTGTKDYGTASQPYKVDRTTEPLDQIRSDGLFTSTTTQEYLLTAFYNESGIAAKVTEKSISIVVDDHVNTWNYSSSSHTNYNIVDDLSGVPRWDCVDVEVTTSSYYHQYHQSTETLERQLLIDGGVVERLKIIENYGVDIVNDKGTVVTNPGCPGGHFFKECAADHSESSNTTGPPDDGDNVLTVISSLTVESNGSVIYTASPHPDGAIDGTDYSYVRQITNRVFGMGFDTGFADKVGADYLYGAHTDTDGIQGPVLQYASYDPYTATVETDEEPIGFV